MYVYKYVYIPWRYTYQLFLQTNTCSAVTKEHKKNISYHHIDISSAAFILNFEHIQELLLASLLLTLSIY